MTDKKIICLGIESSCDETAVALVDSNRNILSHIIYSQIPQHQKYGGVVPELAARSHILVIDEVIKKALNAANKTISDIDVIAATAGPGLIGGVLVGWLAAVGIAQSTGKPLVAINHLEGHALTPRLSSRTADNAEIQQVQFPYLLMLVSGGHCQILLVHGVGKYELIGETLDDSAGEAFDKVSKMLGLGYPGGPVIDNRAKDGNASRYKFPRPLCDKPGCDFSFSGIKTSVRTTLDKLGIRNSELGIKNKVDENLNLAWSTYELAQSGSPLTEGSAKPGVSPIIPDEFINDICASFQAAVCDCIVNRLENSLTDSRVKSANPKTLVVAGGVAKNSAIRAALEKLATENKMIFAAPPLALCTDNGAMIAWAGIENYLAGRIVNAPVAPRPRWPLTEL